MRIRFARFIAGSSSLVRFTLCVNLRTVTVLRPVVFFPHQQKNHLSGGFCWWEQQAHSDTPFPFPRFLYAYPLCSLYRRFLLPRQIYALRKFANGYGSSPCCLFPTPTKKPPVGGFVGGNNRARTCDILRVRQALSQLSYAPVLVTPGRIELPLPP